MQGKCHLTILCLVMDRVLPGKFVHQVSSASNLLTVAGRNALEEGPSDSPVL